MPHSLRLSVALVIAAVVASVTRLAEASWLTIGTTEYDSWPLAVAMMQNTVNSTGRVIHVVVSDAAGVHVQCGQYSLTFDETAASAFALGECDRETQATAVRLIDRAALFDHSGEVPQPRPAGISGVAVLSASARGTAPATSAGTEVRCSVAVRPYLRDLEHGTRVYITPGRFVLRMRDANVSARANGDAWTLEQPLDSSVPSGARGAGAAVTLQYEVFDTERNETVLHEQARLACHRVARPVADAPRSPEERVAGTDTVSDDSSDEAPHPAGDRSPQVFIGRAGVEINGGHVFTHGRVVVANGGTLIIRNGGSLEIGDAPVASRSAAREPRATRRPMIEFE